MRAFNLLNEEEQEIICSLAMLPNEYFSIPQMMMFFFIDTQESHAFFDEVHDLSIQGFLVSDKGLYAIKPSVSDKILSEINPGIEQCPRIVNYLLDSMGIPEKSYEGTFSNNYKLLGSLLERINTESLHLAQLSYLLSTNLIKFSKFNEALKYNQLAVDISEKIDNQHPLVALFYRDKALIYKKLGNTNKAVYYNLKDIEILERQHGRYDHLLPDSYIALSKTYESMRDFHKAVEYNLKAIHFEQNKRRRKSNNLSYLYQNLAHYYSKLNNLKHASIFINKAVEFYSNQKRKNKLEYHQLIKDQRKFNSLYKIEQTIRKLKYPILAILGMSVGVLLWLMFRVIF
jgi:hypothetical protein